MNCKLILSLVLMLVTSPLLGQVDKTGALHSYAQVDQTSGRVTYKGGAAPDAGWGGWALLAVQLNGKYFINASREAREGALLPASTFERRNDSLITTWLVEGCTLTQVVYPYQTGEEYKIVTRYYASVLSGEATIQAQAIIATPKSALTYRQTNASPSGTYFDTMPGHVAFMAPPYQTEVYWRFPPHPVITPKEMIFGDPSQLAVELDWDTKKAEYHNTSHGFGISVIWDSVDLKEGQVKEIGSYIYGAAEYVTCEDSISAKLFFPKRVITPAETIASRTLPMYAYFTQEDSKKDPYDRIPSRFKATVKATNGLTIADLSLAEHPDSILRVPVATSTPTGWSAAFTLDLLASNSTSRYITRSLEFGMEETWLSKTTSVSGCAYSLDLLPRAGKDLIAPAIVDLARDRDQMDCKSQQDTIVISDMATNWEKGIISIEYYGENYTIDQLTEQIKFSPQQSLLITVKDSLQDGYVFFRVVDGEEHVTTRRIDYCTTHDTLRPAVALSTLGGDWIVSSNDDRPWDRRLQEVRIIEAHDIEVKERRYSTDSTTATYRIHPISNEGRFKLIAEDRAGNISDTVSASLNTSGVTSSGRDVITLRSSRVKDHLEIESTSARRAIIVDVLGREVKDQALSVGVTRIDVSSLPPARYYILIEGTNEAIPVEIIR